MLLTFSKPTFVYDILSGRKKHSLREDQHHRWHPGLSIQFWRGNPRNVRSNPFKFGDGHCYAVQNIQIERTRREENRPGASTQMPGFRAFLMEQDRWLSAQECADLAENDGLTVEEFREWFVPPKHPIWVGRIVHFTEGLVY